MNRSTVLMPVTAAVMILSSQSANAQTFSGAYAPANWTVTLSGEGDSVVHNATTLTITGPNAPPPTSLFNTDVTIVVPVSGIITYTWTYDSVDTGTYDSGGFLLGFVPVPGTVYTPHAFNGPAGSPPVSASHAVGVVAGQTFGFRVQSADNQLGAGVLTITNFNFVVPSPGALALLGIAGAVGSRRRRRT